jgi:cytochrome d ubiquinol oxidase subunit II
MDLSLIWAIIIFFAVMFYVLMDGFDLGIGLLFPFVPHKEDRDTMMNTVAPVWDGNETWLVLGGAGLMAAFPLAYSILLSALYLPLIFMLLGLIFRGVAFEFRFKARYRERKLWDHAFIGGSLVAAFFQGVSLGVYILGIPLQDGSYNGGALDWLAPFPLLTGVAVVLGYALLGCTWLIMKTEGGLYRRMVRMAGPLLAALLLITISAFFGLLFWAPAVASHWFSLPTLLWLTPVPTLAALCMIFFVRALGRQPVAVPFLCTLGLVILAHFGLTICIWPNIIPPSVSIWQAAAPASSQRFTLVGALLIIPMILVYTSWAYYVFRGKVSRGAEGYH